MDRKIVIGESLEIYVGSSRIFECHRLWSKDRLVGVLKREMEIIENGSKLGSSFVLESENCVLVMSNKEHW